MDDNVKILYYGHAWAPNLVCANGALEEVMQLKREPDNKFAPIYLAKDKDDARFSKIPNTALLYLVHDKEYDVIRHAFADGDSKVFKSKVVMYGTDPHFKSIFPCHHLLNLPNTREDILFRREAIEELLENKELYDFFEQLLSDPELFPDSHENSYPSYEATIFCDLTPENFSKFFHKILEMDRSGLRSRPLKRLYAWAEEMNNDIYFQEILRKKRKVTDARLIALFSERFADIRYAMLKPGVNPEDVFEFLSPEMTRYFVDKIGRRGKTYLEERKVAKFKDGWDDEILVGKALGHARQRMDIANEISARILAVPVLLAHLQMKHFFQGAFLYKRLQNTGYPVTFPDIAEENGIIEVQNIYPIRMVFTKMHPRFRDQEKTLATNTFHFSSEHKVIQAEGPNKRGKSEAWRTLHLFVALANAGYPVPAESARYSPVPNSHFISCKGEHGHGGSELERSLRSVEANLEDVHPGENVILDELGDSTNAHTARETAGRLLPVLIKKGCRVFVTSHHDALTKFISEELGGLSFMPRVSDSPAERFQLVPREGEVDFRARETLDELEFTSKKIKDKMPKDKRLCAKRRAPAEKRRPGHHEYHDEEDIPF